MAKSTGGKVKRSVRKVSRKVKRFESLTVLSTKIPLVLAVKVKRWSKLDGCKSPSMWLRRLLESYRARREVKQPTNPLDKKLAGE